MNTEDSLGKGWTHVCELLREIEEKQLCDRRSVTTKTVLICGTRDWAKNKVSNLKFSCVTPAVYSGY